MMERDTGLVMPRRFGTPAFERQAAWSVLQTLHPRENPAVAVCDLSHRPKAMVPGAAAGGKSFPGPGEAKWDGIAWYARLCPDEGYFYDLLGDLEHPGLPDGAVDMTDGWSLLSVFGPDAGSLLSRLVAVDVDPALSRQPLFLATRVHNAKVHLLNTRSPMGYLIACDRSYGQALLDFCFEAPAPLGIRPAGVEDFHAWTGFSPKKPLRPEDE